ncbi:Chitinase, GH18 family [Cyclobacterium xiamenense]|uniref:chitinase n=1 Tax=Cyclobacterium xiamenense TaxID=1297121 RepID=A0A1H6YY52_9BACT|nr:glycosyl hydrolase family 18 protein [Cyclobacterium xiamenense]SEJ46148.1 Chitinase, GH18 family [Cyclobacterium xiamenense]
MIRFLFFLLPFSFACSLGIGDEKDPDPPFRVVGYLFSPSDWKAGLADIDWSLYTDVCLAFIQPDANGHFAPNAVYEEIVTAAHKQGANVFVSIGGGEPPEYLARLMRPENREHWVEQLAQLVRVHGFDGVDVDLENALINEDYAPFVQALSRRLKQDGKRMTAALASWNGDSISDEVLALYDWINLMSYDDTGPWNLEKPGQHAPFEMAVLDIQYYRDQRNVPVEKILLGLPFYGYGFGPGAPTNLRYRQILERYPTAYRQDSLVMPEGGVLYYNSPGLIRKKTRLARELGLGGVMVWHIQADSREEHSLSNAIRDELD